MSSSTVVNPAWRFETFRDAILRLPPGELSREHLLADRFRLYQQQTVEGFYAPFDFVNEDARLVLVGITPGFEQMHRAFEEARFALASGASNDSAMRSAKRAASFAGPMRAHLATMLDGIGIHRPLGLSSTADLWTKKAQLLHPTSAIRYPVFRGGQTYAGHTPAIDRLPIFRSFIEGVLAPELRSAGAALVIPLGDAASRAVRWLCDGAQIQRERVLLGFPHPSGGNGHRVRQFTERQSALSLAVAQWFGG